MSDRGSAPASRRGATFAALALVCFTLLSPGAVLALPRNQGDFWTYSVVVDLFGARMTGNVTYTFEREASISVEGSAVPVNVMSVDGSLAGESSFILPVEFGVTLRGEAYETRQGWAFAGLDEVLYLNRSFGAPPAQFVTQSTLPRVLKFSPSLFSGFDPGKVAPGDTWTETVRESGSVTVTNGTELPVIQAVNSTIDFEVVVGAQDAQVETSAGTFICLELTASNASGDRLELSWSDQVGGIVKAKAYQNGSWNPTATLELKDYRAGKAGTSTLYLAAGTAVVAVACIVLALALTRRKPKLTQQPARPGVEGKERM